MNTVTNKLLQQLPTILAALLLLCTIAYHWTDANATPTPKLETSIEIDTPSLKNDESKINPTELRLLLNKPVFGQVPKLQTKPIAKQPVINEPKVIPKTKLNLKLNGVVAKADEKLGHAIIDGKEYRVGEAIDERTSLHAVYSKRVILKYNNKLEELALPNMETSGNSQFAQKRNQLTKRKNLARRSPPALPSEADR